MSTEATNVVSVPSAEDNQQPEKIVKQEAHAVEQGDAPPSKNDAEKHEKETCEAKKSEGSDTCITKSEEPQVVNQVELPVVVEVEKADHVSVQNVEAGHECQPIEAVETAPAGEKPSVEAVEKEEKIATEAVEKEVEKIQTIEAIENEAVVMKTELIEDDKNKPVEDIAIEAVDKEADSTPVEKVAIEAVENEKETQASEACEEKEVKNIAIEVVERESETQATEACEDKAVEKESEKTQTIEADEIKQEETPAIEEQINEKAKVGAYESNPSSEVVKPAEENVEGEKETTDEGKPAACELKTNEEAQTVEKEAGIVDDVKDENLQCERAAEKEEESVNIAPATKESDEKTEEASVGKEVKKTEDGTDELKNTTDQVIEKAVEGEQKSDRDLVEGLDKENEYKDIKENGEEAKDESKTDVPRTLEPCKDGDQETQTSKDQVQDVSAKPAQKPSGNNIISKVKQSLVKVKKAIIGKSPSSKVLKPEIKDDLENVK